LEVIVAGEGDNDHAEAPVDALDVLEEQNRVIAEHLTRWQQETTELEQHDDVRIRWQRGSEAKLLLQYFALRESAIGDVCKRLQQTDHTDLAERLEASGVRRRTAIASLDEQIRGLQAMNANTPETTDVIRQLADIFNNEATNDFALIPAMEVALGEPGERGLATARHVRTHSPTHPNPHPKWYDKIGPIKVIRALYDHLRGSPSGGTKPGVDEGREHTPGLPG
jgi:hypothetical protein